MKRHLQCAEQQKAASNFSKYCACHAKWISWLIHITYETSFTMRGATVNTRPTSPKYCACHAKWISWHDPHHIMKRHLQCAEQQASPSNFTKYCACHAKWISWLIHITYETSFTIRGATGITLQPHQILRLPRKMNLMIDPHHIWNVIYNARSDRNHPPTSPNIAPATQKECHDWSASHMKRHLQCAGATGITLQPHQILRLPRKMSTPNVLEKFTENSWNVPFPMRDRSETWSENDPRTIRAWSDPENANRNPPRHQRLLFALARSRFYWKLQRFPLRLSFQISPHAGAATKSDTWTSPNAAPATKKWHMNFTRMLHLPQKVKHELQQMLHLPRKVTHELHQMLHLPQKVTHELHQMLHLPTTTDYY